VSWPRWRQSRSPRALRPLFIALASGLAGVGLQAGEDGIADAALKSAQRLFGRLAFGELAVVVGAALAVAVADLGDSGHVDDVVEAPVPALG